MKARILNDATPEITARSTEVTIGGKTYDLILTTAATLAITERFGGLSNLGQAMSGASDSDSIRNTVWLITLMANQSVAIHNLWHPESPEQKLTEEAVQLLTAPGDFKGFTEKITEAINKGAGNKVQSGEPGNDGKNTTAE